MIEVTRTEQAMAASSTTGDALERAVEYLLISNLNLRSDGVSGSTGNARLIQEFFAALERMGAPALFLDVGANDGSAGLRAKRLFPHARVLSLEANPHIQRMHVGKLTSAGVESLNVAACGSMGPVTIYVPKTLSRAYVNGDLVPAAIQEAADTGKSSLLKRDEEATYEECQVPGHRLDDLVQDALTTFVGRKAALWVDVEGSAFDVLLGANELLDRTCALLVETESFPFWKDQKQSGDVARLLIAKGFLPVSRDHEYGNKQFNTLFIHSTYINSLLPSLYVAPPLRVEVAETATKPQKSAPRRISSLKASLATEIPVYIPAFNNPTYTSMMVEQLQAWNLRNITVIDNGSTYAPMVRLLESFESTCKVVWLGQNGGPHFLFSDPHSFASLPELFCVTDPDLLFCSEMPQDFLLTLTELTHIHKVGKAGLALSLEDAAAYKQDFYQITGENYRIWEWEARFWTKPAGHTLQGDPVFRADVDTTFALYNKRYFMPERFYDAVRVAGRYACRHLPWYKQSFMPVDEEEFYRANQQFSYYARSQGSQTL